MILAAILNAASCTRSQLCRAASSSNILVSAWVSDQCCTAWHVLPDHVKLVHTSAVSHSFWSKILGRSTQTLPPKSARKTAYGASWEDEYSWLEKDDSRARKAAMKENVRYQQLMQGTASLQQSILQGISSLLPSEDQTVPERCGRYLYFTRLDPSTGFTTFIRTPVSDSHIHLHTARNAVVGVDETGELRENMEMREAAKVGERDQITGKYVREQRKELGGLRVGRAGLGESREDRVGLGELREEGAGLGDVRGERGFLGGVGEEVLLDAATIMQDVACLPRRVQVNQQHVAQAKVSEDGDVLIYTLPLLSNPDISCAFIRHIPSGRLMTNGWIAPIVSVTLSANNTHAVYTVPNELNRPHRIMLRTLSLPGVPSSSPDTCILEDQNEANFLNVLHTKDWQYIVLNSTSKQSQEVHLLDAHDPTQPPMLVQRRQPNLEYFVEHHTGTLYILTNKFSTAGKYALAKCPITHILPPTVSTNKDAFQDIKPFPSGTKVAVVEGSEHDAAANTASGSVETGTGTKLHISSCSEAAAEGWTVVVPEREGVDIVDVDVFHSGCILHQVSAGIPRMSYLPLQTNTTPPQNVTATINELSSPRPATTPTLNATPTLHESSSSSTGMTPPQNVTKTITELSSSSPGPHSQMHGSFEHAGASGLEAVPLPEWSMSVTPGANQDFFSNTVQFSASSLVHPDVTFQFNCNIRTLQPIHTSDLAHQLSNLTCYRINVPSHDGVEVPVTLAHAQNVQLGSNPAVVIVYGAYGHCLECHFQPTWVELARRGWVVALAHVRGGGEFGPLWHQDGRQTNKMNSVLDYIACSKHIVDKGFARRDHLAGFGFSAGGLIVGAAMNTTPDLFTSVILRNPFVDVLSSMVNPNQPLTVHEYDEWGDPNIPEEFTALKAVCPYHNITQQEYPAVHVSCTLDDPRVPWHGPAKYAARLLANQTRRDRPVVLKVNEAGGHFGAEMEQHSAFAAEVGFLYKTMGLEDGGYVA